MKLDILRSTNPALSYAEDEDDPTNQSYYYDKPSPIDLSTIPTRLIAGEIISQTVGTPQDDSSENRSKSAPPAPGQSRHGPDSFPKPDHAMIRRGLSYGIVLEGHLLETQTRSAPAMGFYSPASDDSSTSGSSDRTEQVRNPSLLHEEIYPNEIDNNTNPSGEQQLLTEPTNKASETPTTHSQQSTAHATSSSRDGELPVVVRPNPVKPTQQILGMPIATASSQQNSPIPPSSQQALQQQPHRPIALSPLVSEKVVPIQIVLPQSLRPQPPVQKLQQQHQFSNEQRQPPKPQSERQAWCDQATALKKKEERAREIAREEELRRLQESQCEFPTTTSGSFQNHQNTTSVNNMASGRNAEGNPSFADRSRGGESRPQHVGSHHRTAMSHHSHASRRHTSSSSHTESNNHNKPNNNNNNIESTTPIFDKLVTDEVRELQIYTRMVENQNLEIERMRRYQNDLEKLLEDKSREQEVLEATLEERERDFKATLEDLQGEIKKLRNVVQGEENKNKLLLDHIRKKDQHILGMLNKKKYEHDATNTRSVRNLPNARQPGAFAKSPEATAHRSPDEHLRLLGSAEKVRERNTRHLLMDFFGL